MQQISSCEDAHAVLTSPAFIVPPVPAAPAGVAWLRATVARFSSGPAHERRRSLVTGLLDSIPPDALPTRIGMDPVAVLALALGAGEAAVDAIVGLVRDIAQAYRPGSGDDLRADAAVDRLVMIFGGVFDEPAAARVSLLVQACEPMSALIDRARHRPVDAVLREHPPVPATRRQALAATDVGGVRIEAGEVVQVDLAGDLAFGAGPHRCPGRAHALALARQALTVDVP